MLLNKLKKNINKNYLFTVLSRFDLTHGIWMLYLANRGLTLFQIGIMETIYHVSSFTMEIPTGAIADIYGRKTSRIIGRGFAVIAALIMIYGDSTLAFAISFFFVALSNNLESGAGDALIYDSLKELQIEKEYTKINGRIELFFQISQGLSLLVGGYLATKSYTNVYIVSSVIAFISFLQAFTFKEPSIGRVIKKHSFIATFVSQLTESFYVIKKDKRIVEVILLLELFSTFYVTIYFYLQNRLKELGDSEFIIGITLATGSLIAAILATQTYKIEKRFKLKNIMLVLPIFAIIGFCLITVSGLEKYSFLLLSTIEGILFVTLSDYINTLIPSNKRATILSLQSMVFSFFMIILFPIIGKIGDLFGLKNAFTFVAMISTPVLIFMILIVKRGSHTK